MIENLTTILAKDKHGEYQLWACRGAGRGCKRNLHRRDLKPCDDCMGPLDQNKTLGEVVDELKRGDG